MKVWLVYIPPPSYHAYLATDFNDTSAKHRLNKEIPYQVRDDGEW